MKQGNQENAPVKVLYNDQRTSGRAAWHGDINMPAPPGSYEVLRGRLWSDKKILSFYENEQRVDDYRDIIEKFFKDIGENIDDYYVEYGDSARYDGFVKWKHSSGSYKAPRLEIPPEIRKKIDILLPQFHLAAPGPEKDKIKKELDKLYKQAGAENEREANIKAYIKAAGRKKIPFEKGGGAGMASYTGRLPAIAEDIVQLHNKTLCPELWDSDKHLDPEVRKVLLQIAFDFYMDTELQLKIQDVYLLGSTANYNWTPESDIDVHIVVDGSTLGLDQKTREKFFRSLAGKWNLEHDIKVKGHEVELYIQDINEKNSATAIYSLVKDQWIKPPTPEKLSIDKEQIQKKYSMWVECINDTIQKKDDKKLKKILESLRKYRQAGLTREGEFSTENIVFKILRSRGFLEKIKDAYNQFYDKKMTVDDVFDPTSQGPNPSVDIGQDNGGFYRSMNSKMRRLEENKQVFKSKYFTVFWNIPYVSKGVGVIMLGNEPPKGLHDPNWFANMFRWGGEGKWIINAHTGAFQHKFSSPNVNFETPEELLTYLDDWWSKNQLREGYGAGKIGTDRLKIKNPDGSVRRWQIRSKDAPKTPKMTEETLNLVNEVLDEVLPMPKK